MKILVEHPVGIVDGHEIAMDDSDGTLYLYGPNAAVLFKTVEPYLKTIDFVKGSIAYLTFRSLNDSRQ